MTKKFDVTVWHNGKFVEATIDADVTMASDAGPDSVVISDFSLISHNFDNTDQLCEFVCSTAGTVKFEQAVYDAFIPPNS